MVNFIYFKWFLFSNRVCFLGITSPPYRRTLYEWFDLLIPHLPQCCQRTIRERSKSFGLSNNQPNQINCNQQKLQRFNDNNPLNRNTEKESISLIPR